MSRSPLSIGVIMIVFGGFTVVYALNQGIRPGPLAALCAALYIAGGVTMFLRRRFAFAIAITAGLFALSVGAWGLAKHLPTGPGVPYPPLVTLVAGIYTCLRVAMERVMQPRAPHRLRDEIPPDDNPHP